MIRFLFSRASSVPQLPTLEYTGQGRSGTVYYLDEMGRIPFYYEFGGGDCIATIHIPSQENWFIKTGRPLAEREKIIRFLAEGTTRDQTQHGWWRINKDWIEIMSASAPAKET